MLDNWFDEAATEAGGILRQQIRPSWFDSDVLYSPEERSGEMVKSAITESPSELGVANKRAAIQVSLRIAKSRGGRDPDVVLFSIVEDLHIIVWLADPETL